MADKNRKPDKPAKPRGSPLTPTPRGWVKKIRGKLYWFGPSRDHDAALRRYHAEAPAILAGRPVQLAPEQVTVRELADRYHNLRRAEADAGRLSLGWYGKSYDAITGFVNCVGPDLRAAELRPDHFAAYRRSVQGRGMSNCVRAVRTWIRHAIDNDWCPAVRTGKDFRPAGRREAREAASGLRYFTPDECRKLIDAAPLRSQMRAMVLLALNGGMGQGDLARLTVADIDLSAGFYDGRRHKTGERRRFPLWGEAADAIKWYVGGKTADALLFRTIRGKPMVRERPSKGGKVSVIDQVGTDFDKLLTAASVPKSARNFYSLRRTFRTIADAQQDQRTIALVMGHAAGDVASLYVQRIDDDRLRSVVNFVRDRIFQKASRVPSRRRDH